MQFIVFGDVTRQNPCIGRQTESLPDWITGKCLFVAWNEAEVRNIWFNAPRREVTASAYYSLLFSRRVTSHFLTSLSSKSIRSKVCQPSKTLQQFSYGISSWKCCAKFLSFIHSNNLQRSGGPETKGRGRELEKFQKPLRRAYEKEQKESPKSCLCLLCCFASQKLPKMSIEIKLSTEINI